MVFAMINQVFPIFPSLEIEGSNDNNVCDGVYDNVYLCLCDAMTCLCDVNKYGEVDLLFMRSDDMFI